VEALTRRHQAATRDCSSRKCVLELAAFESTVANSDAVVCRSLSQVLALLSSENALYASFYQLVEMEARRPEDSQVDRARAVADSILFPHFKEHIRFAALSVDGIGVSGPYGQCSMVLKTSSIQERATVFERNSPDFCEQHGLGVDKPVPPGHRASWQHREKLAAAKLHRRIETGMQAEAFASLLLDTSAHGGPRLCGGSHLRVDSQKRGQPSRHS
jgi:hypothetical protein